MTFDDIQHERGYNRWRVYGQSKLASLLFAFELDRRLRAAGLPLLSVAAHPGYADTDLQLAAAPALDRLVMRLGNLALARPAEMGALPPLFAATSDGVDGGTFKARTASPSSAPTRTSSRRARRPTTSRRPPACGSCRRS